MATASVVSGAGFQAGRKETLRQIFETLRLRGIDSTDFHAMHDAMPEPLPKRTIR